MALHKLIENGGNGTNKIYNSSFVDHKNIKILSNKLTMDIIKKLSENKACAMDLSRTLKQHEQKIYYHIRKLEAAGVIKQVGEEQRYGMVAKMYSPVSPVIALKLYDDGEVVEESKEKDPQMLRILHPFIENGKLNAKIIVGDTYPHGKYNKPDAFSLHLIDFFLMLGNRTNSLNAQSYEIDVFIKKNVLEENNIILIGNNTSNTIIEDINNMLPIQFTEHETIVSKATNTEYVDPRVGAIIKCDNPFNKNKKMLVICGSTCRGIRATNLAFLSKLKKISDPSNFGIIVEGLDKNGDGIIDDFKILE